MSKLTQAERAGLQEVAAVAATYPPDLVAAQHRYATAITARHQSPWAPGASGVSTPSSSAASCTAASDRPSAMQWPSPVATWGPRYVAV